MRVMVCRYSSVEPQALPVSSQVVILIVVTLVNYFKYHDKALILPEFSFMKTVQEDEITHCSNCQLQLGIERVQVTFLISTKIRL